MGLSEQIDEIIALRKRRLPKLEHRKEKLKNMENLLDQLEFQKSQIIDGDGKPLLDGRYAELLEQNPDMAWKLGGLDGNSCRTALKEAEQVLDDSIRRFKRDYISISIVGEARKGKSALLQSISGLDDRVIPAFDSTDCTGAPSMIFNRTGAPLSAELSFKTPEQMRRMAQTYLNRMIPKENGRIYLGSMQDIRGLDLNDVLKRTPAGSPARILYPYLEKMVLHYEEWAEFAGKQQPLILTEESEIAVFVAQNNGIPEGCSGHKEYYRYLAVDQCKITCSFPQQDAGKICLIDTVGLEDHTEGILEDMLRTVRDESDAVIFNIMPKDGAGGGIPKRIVEIYKAIYNVCKERNLDKWLFYLVNHVEKATKTHAVNTNFCRSAMQMLKNSGYSGSQSARMVSGIDANAVRQEFLIPMLSSLTENLESVDQIYLDQAETALKKAEQEYALLCTRLQKALQGSIGTNAKILPLLNRMTDESMRQMQSGLYHLLDRWYTRRNEPCAALYACADDIFDRMIQDLRTDSYLPSVKQIQTELENGIMPPIIYTRYANQIRNAISRDFLNVNIQLQCYVEQMKNDVTDVLGKDCGLYAVCGPDDEDPPFFWLKKFSQKVLGKEEEYENIRLAIDTLVNFEFSVKGFLTYEIRNCLDGLDPMRINIPPVIARNQSQRIERTAANIHMELLTALCDIENELRLTVKRLSVKPNLALCAEINEFYDRMVYAEGVDLEWRNFYAEKAAVLWADQIRSAENISSLFQDWVNLADNMQKLQ